MRSKTFQRILDKTPEEVKIFVRHYGDIVVRINELLEEKGYTQKQLAEKMDKKPSEISKWLNGQHNFTLRSIAKLEAELGAPILYVPKRKEFQSTGKVKTSFTVHRNVHASAIRKDFTKFNKTEINSQIPLDHVS